jgi:hypothetical protein
MKRIIYAALGLLGFFTHAQTGPGGVGNSSNNALWLDATKLTGYSNGDVVSSWPDVSGNGFDAATLIVGREPSYNASGFGGRAGVLFNNANNDYMVVLHNNALNRTTGGFYAAAVRRGSNTSANGGQGVLSKRADLSSVNHYNLLFLSGGGTNNQLRADANANTLAAGSMGVVNASTNAIISSSVNGSSMAVQLNGIQLNAGPVGSNPSPNDANLLIGALGTAGAPATDKDFDGTIHEIVVYNAPLNDAQRLIVLNYLGAKYSQSLGLATRFSEYAYGTEVAGVGRAASGQEHLVAQGPGLLRITASGLSNDTWLLWGHNGAALARNAIKPAGITEILSRSWKFEETGTVPAVTVSIDQTTLEGLFPLFARGVEVIVSTDATFDGSDPTYPLTLNAGNYEASIDLPVGGSYVTLVQKGFILLDQGQWSGGLLAGKPDATDPADHAKDLVVAGSGILDVSARITDLEVLSGQTLEVAAGQLLQVDGSATNAGSILLRASSQSTYAQYYGPSTPGVTMGVYSVGSGWHNLASPFTGMTLAQFAAANPAGMINTSSFPNLYSYNPNLCGGSNIGLGATQAWGTWEQMTNTSAVLVGQGFNLFSHPYYGNSNAEVRLLGTTPDPSIPQNVPVSANHGGWNMVPNPFTTAVDWVDVYSTNASAGVDGFMYVWDPIAEQYKVTDNTGLGINGGSRYLAPGQAFWVRFTASITIGSNCLDFSNGASTSIAFTGAHREPSQSPIFNRMEAKPTGSILLEVQNITSGRKDQVYLQFDSSWSNQYVPGEDALKFMGLAPNLYAVQGMHQLVFARYHATADSVLLGIQAADGDSLKLTLVSNSSHWALFDVLDLQSNNSQPFDSVFTFVQDGSFGPDRWVLQMSNLPGIGIPETTKANLKAWFGQGALHLMSDESMEAVELYGLSGQLLLEAAPQAVDFQRSLTLPSGVYLMRVRMNGQWQTIKLLHP